MEKILVEMENAIEEIVYKAISMISCASITDWLKFGFQILKTPFCICILLILIIGFTIIVYQREGVNILTVVKSIVAAILTEYGIIMLLVSFGAGKFVLILLSPIILVLGMFLIMPNISEPI